MHPSSAERDIHRDLGICMCAVTSFYQFFILIRYRLLCHVATFATDGELRTENPF